MLETTKKPWFLHLDHADPRRGSREHRRNRKKPCGFAPGAQRPAAEGAAVPAVQAGDAGTLQFPFRLLPEAEE